ncbi:hypothetical protein ACFSNO_18965 [Streptomyces cirratus]
MATTESRPASAPPRDAGSTAAADVPARRISPQARGMLALAATVAIWAAFALSARALSASSLLPADAALLLFSAYPSWCWRPRSGAAAAASPPSGRPPRRRSSVAPGSRSSSRRCTAGP